MKVLLYLVLFIPMIIALDQDTSHKKCKNYQDDEKIKRAEREIADANMQFSLNLFKHVASKSSEARGSPAKNILFSPLSISTAFAMLTLGAKSTTRQEIMVGLSFNQKCSREKDIHKAFSHLLLTLNKSKSDLQVRIGNAIFIGKALNARRSFIDRTSRYYYAEIANADFSHPKNVEKQINDYVKKKTEGKIEELVKDLDPGTSMILINYILFKGEWENIFHPDSTRVGTFSVDKDTKVEVQMMSRTGLYKSYDDEDLPCTVIVLPYKNNASMLLAVPKLGSIRKVEEALSVNTINRWRKLAKAHFIHLYLPKFSSSATLELKEVLTDLGIVTAFSNSADFSGITYDTRLKVSKAVHKAVLNVDEKGTEAAGATAIVLKPTAGLVQTIKVDRPFIFMITEDTTNTILFQGKITNPTKK